LLPATVTKYLILTITLCTTSCFAETYARDGLPDLSAAEELLLAAIEGGAFPGCAVVVGDADGVIWKAGLGRLDYDAGSSAVTTSTLYDLASITKVVGTTSVIFSLIRDGKLALDDRVVKHVPEFGGEMKDGVTIEHLLTHTSGLLSWRSFYKTCFDPDAILAEAYQVPVEAEPGTRSRYSDIGFIILGGIAARAGEAVNGELERQLVFEPLGMKDTVRNPGEEFFERIAPTETSQRVGPAVKETLPRYKDKFVHADVHDENARGAGGMTGHAGLFSTADDLALFAGELLRGVQGKSAIFVQPLFEKFVTRRNLIEGSSRALGWDTPEGERPTGGLFSRNSFGHTGFTGTSLWVDAERGFYLILLTNRVHPTRENQQIRAVRRELGDVVVRCLVR